MLFESEGEQLLRIGRQDRKPVMKDMWVSGALAFLVAFVPALILFIVLNKTLTSNKYLGMIIPLIVVIAGFGAGMVKYLMKFKKSDPYYICLSEGTFRMWQKGKKEEGVETGSEGLSFSSYKPEGEKKYKLEVRNKDGSQVYATSNLSKKDAEVAERYFENRGKGSKRE